MGATGSGGSGGDGGAEGVEGLGPRKWAMLAVLTLSSFIILLDASVVNVSVPAILEDLGGTLDQTAWVLAGYVLSFAVFLITFGRLGDLYGRRRVFVAGVTVFALASLAAALSPSLGFLIGARVAQGIGAAMMQPATISLIKATFPPQRLGLAFGVQGVSAGLATGLGPPLGGLITTGLSWHYVFLLNLPVGLFTVLAAWLVISESRAEDGPRRLDVLGVLSSAAAIFFLVFALLEGQNLGWGSGWVAGSLAASAAALVLFLLAERGVEHPLVDLTLFRDRLFAVGNVLRAITQFALLGMFFALPLFLQTQLGYSAVQSGLALLPLSLVALFVSPVAGNLADRVDVRWLVSFGMLVCSAGIFWLAQLSADTGWAFFVAPLAVVGFGLSFLFAPTTTATLRNVPREKSGAASGISFTASLAGGALGLAIVGAVLQNRFVANVRAALSGAGLPPELRERIASGPSSGAANSHFPPASGPQAERTEGFIRAAFADATAAALLCGVVATLLGAVIAVLFFSCRAKTSKPQEPERGPA